MFLLIIPAYSELCNEVCPYQVEKLGKSIFCYYSQGENGLCIGDEKPKQWDHGKIFFAFKSVKKLT